MRWHILAIGKPKLEFARDGIAEYTSRLKPMAQVELNFLKSSNRESESANLRQRSEEMFRVVLDERGEQVTSRAFASRISSWEQARTKAVAVIVGGADG